MVIGGGGVLMSEVPLYQDISDVVTGACWTPPAWCVLCSGNHGQSVAFTGQGWYKIRIHERAVADPGLYGDWFLYRNR